MYGAHSKLILSNNVTLTMRYLVMLDSFGDVSSGATAELLDNMPENETAIFSMEHAAYLTPFCYPPTMTEAFLGHSRYRPPGFPGENEYNATAHIPADLMAMGGGIDGADAVLPADSVRCTNDTRAPPMRRCLGHVAYLKNFAVTGATFDAARQILYTGYNGYIVDTYMLCAALLDEECIVLYTPYGCLQRLLSSSAAAAAAAAGDVGGGGGGSNDTAAAAAAPLAFVDSPAAPPPSKRGGTRVALLVGVLIGGIAALVVAAVLVVLAVRWRRRRARHAVKVLQPDGARMANLAEGDGSSSGTSPGDEAYGAMPRRSPVGTGGGFVSSSEAAAKSSPAAAAAAAGKALGGGAATGILQNSSECDIDSDLAVPPSRAQPGASPQFSDLFTGLVCSSPVEDAEKQAGRGPVPGRGSQAGQQSEQQQQPQQQGGQQQGEGCIREGGGGGAPDRDVVVTPFTPLRRDLQLWQDPAQKVTLLPVVRGKGSYGKVCEGLYGGQRVAVKLVRDLLVAGGSRGPTDKIVTTFAQEVEVLGRCCHPNVVQLLAACMTPPRFCLVMELMETSLQRLVFKQAPGRLLPLPLVLHIGCEIARALEYLHPTIVHRDLKPDNVLISNADSPEPIVKVSDFGLSRLRCTVSPTQHPEAGTPSYMAPECFDLYVSCITHHVDIYSWAVLVWTMLSGTEPWKDCGVVEIAYRVCILNERLLLNELVASGRCPPRLHRLLTLCWSRAPERRPAAAEVVKEMLLIMQQQERPGASGDLDENYMVSPGSVLHRIREYQGAAAAAAAPTSTSAAPVDGTTENLAPAGPIPATATGPAAAAAAAAAPVSATDAVGADADARVATSAVAAAVAVLAAAPSTPPAATSSSLQPPQPSTPVASPCEAGAAAAAPAPAVAAATAIAGDHGESASSSSSSWSRNAVVINVNELVAAAAAAAVSLPVRDGIPGSCVRDVGR
ncbi:hypothetical protein PLESTF_001776100 [Pleodorina starrii]|nr:hypothetical protein PLESTF_001776100 [Pleodorina starrii]